MTTPSAPWLAIDAATDRPTVALGTAAEPGADVAIAHRHDLSRDLDAVVRGLLAARGVTAAELGAVVVSDGPGSFTGLRIGIAFAKGVTRVLGIPLWAAPSLMGAARAVASAGLVMAEYDALRGEVYRAIYRFEPGAVTTLLPASVVAASSRADLPSAALRAAPADASASALLRLTALRGGAAALADPALWEPAYGRPAEAEARRLAGNGPL